MAKKTQPPNAPSLKVWTPREIPAALTKLRRLKQEISALKAVAFDNAKIEVIENNVRDTILEIYGSNTPEYSRMSLFRIVDRIVLVYSNAQQRHSLYENGVNEAITKIDGLIARIEQKASEIDFDHAPIAVKNDDEIDLHPHISGVATELFDNGHYDEAVFAAAKILVKLVKERSQIDNLDGQPLMMKAFSPDNPILKFNGQRDMTDIDEQKGMMFLFAGAVGAIRNPGAHDFQNMPAKRALQYLSFLSMLLERLEDTKR